MKRVDKIIAHLKSMGAQHVGDAGDKIVTDRFTEYIFRFPRLPSSVRVRLWHDQGSDLIEVLFARELCAGSNRQSWEKTPDMDWVLLTIESNLSNPNYGEQSA